MSIAAQESMIHTANKKSASQTSASIVRKLKKDSKNWEDTLSDHCSNRETKSKVIPLKNRIQLLTFKLQCLEQKVNYSPSLTKSRKSSSVNKSIVNRAPKTIQNIQSPQAIDSPVYTSSRGRTIKPNKKNEV